MNSNGSDPMVVYKREKGLSGTWSVPGDKSITHRALFFAALSGRRTIIRNPSPAHDCRSTLLLLRALGYHITERIDCWEFDPSRRSSRPQQLTLDCGNSGTTARLAVGFLTGERGEFFLVGDESLSRRPMERVAAPLRRMGGRVFTTNGSFPVSVIADGAITPTEEIQSEEIGEGREGESEVIEVGSAQVHTALVLAAARSGKGIPLRRTKPMRDHTLRMAPHFGIAVERRGEYEFVRPLNPQAESADASAREINVPGDPSSAAFLFSAALLVPGSDLTIENVGLNPTRTAFFEVVRKMGGDIEWSVRNGEGNDCEPVGTVRVRYSPGLRGVVLEEPDAVGISVALMMDELPLLALIASQARGETVVRGAAELRVKESDRIAATTALLALLGIAVEEREDGFRVVGPQPVKGGADLHHYGDHRLAMLAGISGLIAEKPIVLSDPDVAAVSWPGFWKLGIFD